MDILMLNPFYYPYQGGTEKHIRQISRILTKKGHNVTVLSAQLPGTEKEEVFEGVKIIRTPSRIFHNLPYPLPPPYPLMRRFAKDYELLLDKGNFDIVHMHNRFVFSPSILSKAREKGAKTALTIHNARPQNIDFATDLLGQLYDNLLGQDIIRKCNGTVGVSKWALDATIPKSYDGKTAVVYNGFDPSQYNPKSKKGNYWEGFFEEKGFKGKMILTNARLVKQKGLEYLIKGMKNVEGAYLVILGRGPLEKELRKLAAKNNVNVYFQTEVIPEERLAELYSSAYIFTLSSLYEPCGVVLIEAQAMGTPIIATAIGGINEIVKQGETGILVEPRRPEAFAESISYLIKNEDERDRLAKNAIEFSRQFSWENTANKVEEFYNSILD